MPNKAKAKSATKKTPAAAKSKANPRKLHPDHSEKILSLHPEILDAVHDILKTNGVDAVVHRISYVPSGAGEDNGGSNGDDWPCGDQPCCYINGVWTCR
jgi:hypothetical protein